MKLDGSIDELIERSLRNEITPEETAWLRVWKHESPNNARRYEQIVRLRLALRPHQMTRRTPPTAWQIIALATEPRRFPRES